jgi:hypothetical protein
MHHAYAMKPIAIRQIARIEHGKMGRADASTAQHLNRSPFRLATLFDEPEQTTFPTPGAVRMGVNWPSGQDDPRAEAVLLAGDLVMSPPKYS